MLFSPFFVYALPVITVVAVGALGSTRRLGFWLTLILAVLLTPIGGAIAAIISGPRRRKRQVIAQGS
jgi:VIT1/CCC1 family predicted Fe2+/Mn2+ transporter